jgi:hypothetical protein
MSSFYPQEWTELEAYNWLLRELPHSTVPPQLRSRNGTELLSLTRVDLEDLFLSETLIDALLIKLKQLKQDAEDASLLSAMKLQKECLLSEEDVDAEITGALAVLEDECRLLESSLRDRSYAEMLNRLEVDQVCQERSDFEIALRYYMYMYSEYSTGCMRTMRSMREQGFCMHALVTFLTLSTESVAASGLQAEPGDRGRLG